MEPQGCVLTKYCDILVVHFSEESFISELTYNDDPDGGFSMEKPRMVNGKLWIYPGYKFTLHLTEDDFIEFTWNGSGIKHLGGNGKFQILEPEEIH